MSGQGTHADAMTCDLVVVGAGCAGMAAAVFAAAQSLSVTVLERTAWVGGTSALSAGALWIPNTRHAQGAGDSVDQARRYLHQAIGESAPSDLIERFLALGPQAVEVLERESDVQLRAFTHHPDYLAELPDATLWGRVLECLPFDARSLGRDLALVRPPIPEFTVLGGMMVDRIDIGHLLGMTRSFRSFGHSVRLLARYGVDRLSHPRGTRLVLGNALVGRLLSSLRRRGVALRTQADVGDLIVRDGRVCGVRVRQGGAWTELVARRGVILAGGGFLDHPVYRERLISAAVRHTPRAGGAVGQLLDAACALGARVESPGRHAACWAPVSVRRRADGSQAVFPHFVLDRAKPGTLVVDASGNRFLNESVSYHQFVERMLAGDAAGQAHQVAYLIADREALRRYGLGMVRPGGRGWGPFVRDGYLTHAADLADLARQLELDAASLQATVRRFNQLADTGVDADFHRGETAYQKNLGDAACQPNPTLRALRQGPYFAVRLYPADIAASAGLVTDADARVLAGDTPIPGLFAIGNEMRSVMGDAYPGPGINLGPAVVFAYAAVLAAVANS